MPAAPSQTQRSGASRNVRESLLQKLAADERLYAMGTSISRVVQLASSDDEAAKNLANYVLSDVALTQKILRVSNTVSYRTSSGAAVTTISRAIFLLGFDSVKTTALAMLLVDNLSDDQHAVSVQKELEVSLCASLVGREMSRYSHHQNAEEASIAALFKNLTPVLLASHEHERYKEIAAITAGGSHTLAQASQLILGCSYDMLAEAVLKEWKIPDMLINAMTPVAPGPQKTAANRAEWMRQVACFSVELGRLIARGKKDPDASPEGRALLTRFGAALNLDQDKMHKTCQAVAKEIKSLYQTMGQAQPSKAAAAAEEPISEDLLAFAMLDGGVKESANAFHPSGKPLNARDYLLAGVQDVTQMRASGCKVNELVFLALETIHRAMGARFTTICLKDVKTDSYRARISLGQRQSERQAGFCFPLASRRDLFHLAMENDSDLMIADTWVPKIRDLVPDWHRNLLPDARSFLVLPLVVEKKQLGLFYADRTLPAPEGVPPDETALIKALKAQVLAALSHR